MLPTFFTGSSQEEVFGSFGFFSLPEIAIVGSVASFAYNLIALQVLVKHRGCPAILANGVTMLMGGFLALGSATLFEHPWIKKEPWTFAGFMALQIVISNLICSNLQANLLKHYSPTFMAFAGFLAPLCAAFFGWLFLNEKMYVQYFISLVLVLIGLIIFYLDEVRKHKQLSKTMMLDTKEF